MFLKSIELYGFKSFADKTRLEFSEGATSLLGPNGCGKSNIVDAIKWVLGEQSTKTLRASKMEDVIFNGTETRKPLQVAEVTLVLDNETGLLPLEQAEVEIRRRIHRSGESEFFINRNQVRLRDIRELFYDTGVGKSAYSILEQGKIDQILSTRPEDRRYIFEEAAGITRYKNKITEAQRKLDRTEENLMQVENIMSEVRRQWELRKNQASKAQRYREAHQEQLSLEVDIQLASVQNLIRFSAEKRSVLETTKESFEALQIEIKEYSELLEEQQVELRRKSDQRIALQGEIQRLEDQQVAKSEQLKLVQQRYRDFLKSRDESLERHQRFVERQEKHQEEIRDLQEQIESAQAQIKELEAQLASKNQIIAENHEMITRNETDSEQHQQKIEKLNVNIEELTVQLQELADSIVLELDAKLAQSGYSSQARQRSEKQFTTQLEAVQKLIASNHSYTASLEKMRDQRNIAAKETWNEWSKILHDLGKQVEILAERFAAYKATSPAFIDELLAPQGIITQKHQIDDQLMQLRRNIEGERHAIATLREAKEGLLELVEQLHAQRTELQSHLHLKRNQIETATALLGIQQRNINELTYMMEDVLHEAETAQERAQQSHQAIQEVEEQRQQIKLAQQEQTALLHSLGATLDEEASSLTSRRSHMNNRYELLNTQRSEIDKLTFHLESIEQQIESIYTNFFDNYGRSLKEYEERLDGEIADVTLLREELATIKKQIQQMGYINHMAEEEFREIDERYQFLDKQITDLVKAKTDLELVINEIRSRSEELFLESFEQINSSFQQMFTRLFGGGRAELTLMEPETPLESGIDILAQPPGKRLDRLAPLSGGEKSLTAVALLFATYKVKPSPFCLLDEIDAALDDRNIGNFLSVLEEFAQHSQFIIITHNKRTVMGSKTLLGVTMEERGVSKAIAWRMGWDADQGATFEQQLDRL